MRTAREGPDLRQRRLTFSSLHLQPKANRINFYSALLDYACINLARSCLDKAKWPTKINHRVESSSWPLALAQTFRNS